MYDRVCVSRLCVLMCQCVCVSMRVVSACGACVLSILCFRALSVVTDVTDFGDGQY